MAKNLIQKNAFFLILTLGTSLLFSGCTFKSKIEPPNTLHLFSIAKIKGLDPIYADDLYSGTEVARVYEGLLQYHYLKRPYVLIPNLSESMPEISPDGKTLTFQIKKGVLFQDNSCFKATQGKGRELKAEDFVYSFKLYADPKLTSSSWWLFDGKILGLNEWRDAAIKADTSDYSLPIEGLKALDHYTLQIKLKQRSTQFLFSLAMPNTAVVPREAAEHYGKEFINHPVGTGPFRLEEYNPSSKLIWIKNPTYRKEYYPSEGEPGDKANGLLEDAGKELPLADQIAVTIHVETQPQWLNFLAGKLDFSSIPKDNFATAITASKELNSELTQKGIKLIKSPSAEVTHETFNMADPLIGKNKLLRQALSLAHNQEKINELFYNFRSINAQGPIPPGLSGYDPLIRNPYRIYNLEKAKELLAKAGYPGGKGLPPIEYLNTADSTARQFAEFTQKSFSEIGVTLKVSTSSWPEFQGAIKNKKGQMWGFAWLADYPDAENFLQLFYSKNASPGPNDSNYSNPDFDKLYEKSLTLTDNPERTEIYKKMVKILVEDSPWIFGAHRITYTLTHPWIKNLKPNDFEHSKAKYYRVDPTLKPGNKK